MRKSFIDNGYTGDFMLYIDQMPDGCPPHPVKNHQYTEGTVPYAFKAYMMKQAMDQGYRYIYWVDSVIKLISSYEALKSIIADIGYYFSNNGAILGEYTSDRCLRYFKMNREDIMSHYSFSSGIMFLDCHQIQCRTFIEMQYQTAFIGGPYCGHWHNRNNAVSDDPRVKGHRPHQSTVNLIALGLDMTRVQPNELLYKKISDPDQFYRFEMMEPEDIAL